MARKQDEIWTAWATRSGRIHFDRGVGFPNNMLPICCGQREAMKLAFQVCRKGDGYNIPGVTGHETDQVAVEALEKLRVNMTGRENLMSYFQGMNRRDLG
ncbi:hypothetical protein [Acetobacter sp. DsW_063]|uniref:hypothetical protein n=1 Tax=Acetobacter sp. DsW_063 TaxID=1514894 RepID=UPI000A36C288|nr:hypothetical protein [Acetobacter sp. DsW_063]OUJ17082.1 hypothetical protein HK28_07895 [Acetobacter sp. DsW_063]